MSQSDTIYHVTDQATLEAASNEQYSCASLDSEQFIHCCTTDQLAGVLERYYQGATGLKLLTINVALLEAKLVYENTVGGEESFPHVYGPINLSAVTNVEDIAS
ncbi:MAG: DUF952 domain-containing protein [Pseudomonadota bacterium]